MAHAALAQSRTGRERERHRSPAGHRR